MIVVIEALDAWCPPTLSPDGFGRTRFAWCTIAVASQSTRRSTATRVSVPVRAGAAVIGGSSSVCPAMAATSLVTRRLVDYRVDPLLRRTAEGS
jgi:hypothetical protein